MIILEKHPVSGYEPRHYRREPDDVLTRRVDVDIDMDAGRRGLRMVGRQFESRERDRLPLNSASINGDHSAFTYSSSSSSEPLRAVFTYDCRRSQ